MAPLLDRVLEHVPPPAGERAHEPFALPVNAIGGDRYLGRLVNGKVCAGSIALGQPVVSRSRATPPMASPRAARRR